MKELRDLKDLTIRDGQAGVHTCLGLDTAALVFRFGSGVGVWCCGLVMVLVAHTRTHTHTHTHTHTPKRLDRNRGCSDGGRVEAAGSQEEEGRLHVCHPPLSNNLKSTTTTQRTFDSNLKGVTPSPLFHSLTTNVTTRMLLTSNIKACM